jgi:hypothetical protein
MTLPMLDGVGKHSHTRNRLGVICPPLQAKLPKRRVVGYKLPGRSVESHQPVSTSRASRLPRNFHIAAVERELGEP